MWLLDTTSLVLSAFFGDSTPRYAILSHTWGEDEVSFQDIQRPHSQISNHAGYKKILSCCTKAVEAGFKWIWIDTCCIDKTNSTELSEAINSMFAWYKNATTCYAYLEDVKPEGPVFTASRWFLRGWTLQELIAPTNVLFFDHHWNAIGSRETLRNAIGPVTRIPGKVLLNKPSKDHCIAEIMSWAAGRKTTRIEDRGYSLLGLFGVNMLLIYGEGDNSFLRLQLEIMKITTDHSILAWNALPVISQGKKRGALATSVDEFGKSSGVRSFSALNESSFEMTNLGLRITLPCIEEKAQDNQRIIFASLNCFVEDSTTIVMRQLGIWLNEAVSENNGQPLGRFVRAYLDEIPASHGFRKRKPKLTTLYIIQPYFQSAFEPVSESVYESRNNYPCSIEYSGLVRARYELEGIDTMSQTTPLLERDKCRISFHQNRTSLQRGYPKLIFLKHADCGARIWVAFARHDSGPNTSQFTAGLLGKIWVMVDGSTEEGGDPGLIAKDRPLDPTNTRWDNGVFLEDGINTRVYDKDFKEKAEVVLTRATIGDEVGFMVKVTLSQSSLLPYLELKPALHHVPLQSFLTVYEFNETSSFGQFIRVDELDSSDAPQERRWKPLEGIRMPYDGPFAGWGSTRTD